MKRAVINIILLLMLVACIEPIVFENPGTEDPIAISGFITDQYGPHLITVGYSVPYTNKSFNGFAFVPVSTAIVTIIDNNDEEFLLRRESTQPGYYYTEESFKGVPGNSYKLHVVVDETKVYESEWTKLNSVSLIKDLAITPYESYTLQNGVEVVEKGIKAIVSFSDPVEEENYYRWRWYGTYEVQFSLDRKGPCWITERDIDNLNVLSDGFQNGLEISHTTALIEIRNRPNAQNKYVLTVEQYSIPKEAYEFYRTVDDQRKQQGTIFDSTPAPIEGNMKSINNQEEIVLGIFHASAVDLRRITIETIIANAGEIVDCDEFIRMGFQPPTLCYNCKQLPHSTREKPEWY